MEKRQLTPYLIARECFYVLTLACAIFFALEFIKPAMVQAHISLNKTLLLWLAAGMVTVYLQIRANHK